MIHLVAAQQTPTVRNVTLALRCRLVWCGGLSWLLVRRVSWLPFFSHHDLLVGKVSILTISHLLSKAREVVLLHKCSLAGAYK